MEAGPLKNPDLPEVRKEAMRDFAKDFGGAPVLVAVICPPATNEADCIDYPLAAAAAVQNLLLAAWDKQLGSVWLSLGQVPQAQGILNIQSGYSVIGIVALGSFDAAPPAQPRTPVAKKLRQIP